MSEETPMNTDDRALADLKDEQSFQRIMSILDAIPDTRRDDDLETLSVGALRLIRSRLAADRLEAFHANGNAAAFAAGQEAFERIGVTDDLRRVVRASLDNDAKPWTDVASDPAALQSPPPVVSEGAPHEG